MGYYSDAKIDVTYRQLLIDKNIVNAEILNQAVQQSKISGRSLIDILSTDYSVSEKKLYDTLLNELGFSYFDIFKSDSIEKSVVSKVPIKIAWHYCFMPVRLQGNNLTIVVEYPLSIKTQDELRLQLGYSISQMLASRLNILMLLKKYYGFAANTVEKIVSDKSFEEAEKFDELEPIDSIDKMADDASVVNLVNEIIYDAFKKRATDIHFEPYRGEFRLRYRIDGILHDANLSASAHRLILPILSRIKIMANLDIVERRLPQDGRAIVKVNNETMDLRISSIPASHGESVVIRILPTQMILDLKKLGLTDRNIEILESLIKKPHGILLLTGPTGSGKTTTLYACLNRIDSKEKKIITIEDPVEYEMPGITQIQVSPKSGLDFAKGLRSMLRHDPDVMMVGEIRDFETAEIAIRAALTGHLVFSTLHTNDAVSGVTRLLDIGIEPFLVASSVEAIIAQRLVRVICPHCKVEDTAASLSLKEKIAYDLQLSSASSFTIYKGEGCQTCGQTGFLGRTAIHEILVLSEVLKELVAKKLSSQDIRLQANKEGVKTLLQDGWEKVIAGVTTPGEVLNVVSFGPETMFSSNAGPKEGGAAASFLTRQKDARLDREDASEFFYMKEPSERRIYERLDEELTVYYREIEIQYRLLSKKRSRDILENSSEKRAVTKNISAGGLLLLMQENLFIGAILELRFKLPGSSEKMIECLGRIVRIEELPAEDKCLVGIMFLDLPTEDRVVINQYVESRKSKPI